MIEKSIQDILPFIEKPSRYLGSEVNSLRKDPERVKLRFALAFPDMYEIGTSHFGLQILYSILNEAEEIAAERVYSPAPDMEARLRAKGLPICSLESGTPLGDFNIIGVSLLYELNFTNVLNLLDMANIPLLARDRDNSFPFVIAGGPCMVNPEPVAEFFDAIVIGDGEETVSEMARAWIRWKDNPPLGKESLLKKWSEIPGVYIPSFFEPKYDRGFQIVEPVGSASFVSRAILGDLDSAPFPEKPIVPYGKPVHDRLRLEVARGCTRGCRFCQAGMIYRPVRERSPQKIMGLAKSVYSATGYKDISLLSLSTGDYSSLIPLMTHLMGWCEPNKIAVSFPSLRAGTLTPELMELIKKVRKTGFTIAPEAGSQRLRNVINKNITEEEIFQAVENAFKLGWRVVKLYFMMGLPLETDKDLEAIPHMVEKLSALSKAKGRGKINASVGTFIPKSHTPFQWAGQMPLEESGEKLAWLKEKLNRPGIHFKWQNPHVSRLEGLFARGDRKLAKLLVAAFKMGCKFDGWTDMFRRDVWEEAFSQTGIDPDFYTTRKREMDEPLPWDHINIKVTKEFLKEEWDRAVKEDLTYDCRDGECQGCGVCDFDSIEPRVFTDEVLPEQELPREEEYPPEAPHNKIKVSYSKMGKARFFGHLELVNIFVRAIHRAKIPVKYSQGFHPMPKISFDDPLPMGMASLEESFIATIPETFGHETIMERLGPLLPKGLTLLDCKKIDPGKSKRVNTPSSYTITLKSEALFSSDMLNDFISNKEVLVHRISKKGAKRTINLKSVVLGIEINSPKELSLTLGAEQGKTTRPAEILRTVFNLLDEDIKSAEIVKYRTAN